MDSHRIQSRWCLRSILNKNILYFIILNILDVLMTSYIVANGGVELMPLARSIILHFAMPGLILYKIVMMVSTIVTLVAAKKTHLMSKINLAMLAICLFLFAGCIFTFFSV